MNSETSPDDLIVWPDGMMCYRHELPEMNHKSDDYKVVPFDSQEWHSLHNEDWQFTEVLV